MNFNDIFEEIKSKILFALNHPEMMKKAIHYNLETIKPTLDFDYVRTKVLEKYNAILQ